MTTPTDSTHLRIAAKRDGFRRCGRAWTTAPQVVARSEFSAGQLARLDAIIADPAVDPALDVAPCGPEGLTAAGAAAAGRPAPAAPATVAEAREALLVAGICTLDPGTSEHFTATGLPAVDALESATGLASVSADERDRAWIRAGDDQVGPGFGS